ncbi:MAG TPA: 3-isopropylmalate dehydratase small subunit [Opitutae bacterium]|mgnify:FL=1|nr:3-isopropylmalate dehydratase small subunit [Puniceicoccaceae bacterium]HCY58839.1 3-isopropylmalate dehydratase small subunit [Opitutae bacterium]|tara:strand:+ start:6412 stop:7008 length:597 start_codon:yes stop_codon:yes gene_type:complete
MALAKITEVTGKGICVLGDDIDTDRIIPARFMKCVTFDGLGEYLFHDVRFDEDGKPKVHSLNDPAYQNASIIISGANFGCGSSREHAPQSIYRAGFRAIIAGNFAEIFFGNSINLGMPCLSMNEANRKKLSDLVIGNPDAVLKIDLIECKLRSENLVFPFTLNEGARDSLIRGMWDPLDELIEANSEIERVSRTLNYT